MVLIPFLHTRQLPLSSGPADTISHQDVHSPNSPYPSPLPPQFWVHSVKVAEPDQIKLRWTARCFLPVPVPFNLRDALAYELTGESTYTVDTRLGLITRHVDTWDALKPNQQAFFSNEGLRDVVATSTQAILQAAPALETPEYVVLKRTAKYEIRR